MLSLVENLFLQKKPLQDYLSNLNAIISTNESTEFITGDAIYNPAYTYKFQLKTTIVLPGDHISIFPENDPELVNEVMKRLSEVPKENEIVVWNGNYNKH